MPEFQVSHDSVEATDRWSALDPFLTAYLEAALWLLNEDDQNKLGEGPYGIASDHLSQSAFEDAADDCQAFRDGSADDLAEAYATGYSESQAGHDFFLTRNHHGAGFWDRGLGPVGDRLSKDAHGYGDANLYLGDDGKLYFE